MRMVEQWVVYSLIALVSFSVTNFLFKFVEKENPLMVSLIEFSAAALLMIILLLPQMKFSISPGGAAISMIIGLSLGIGTLFLIRSISAAPNPGYAVAIGSMGFVLITIASFFVFKSPLSLQKVAGILATIVGLVLLSI